MANAAPPLYLGGWVWGKRAPLRLAFPWTGCCSGSSIPWLLEKRMESGFPCNPSLCVYYTVLQVPECNCTKAKEDPFIWRMNCTTRHNQIYHTLTARHVIVTCNHKIQGCTFKHHIGCHSPWDILLNSSFISHHWEAPLSCWTGWRNSARTATLTFFSAHNAGPGGNSPALWSGPWTYWTLEKTQNKVTQSRSGVESRNAVFNLKKRKHLHSIALPGSIPSTSMRYLQYFWSQSDKKYIGPNFQTPRDHTNHRKTKITVIPSNKTFNN